MGVMPVVGGRRCALLLVLVLVLVLVVVVVVLLGAATTITTATTTTASGAPGAASTTSTSGSTDRTDDRPHALLVSFPWFGHVHPLLRVGRALARHPRRAFRVSIGLPGTAARTEPLAGLLARFPEVELLDLGDLPAFDCGDLDRELADIAAASARAGADGLFSAAVALPSEVRAQYRLFSSVSRAAAPLLPRLIRALSASPGARRPDVVVADVTALQAMDACHLLHIPFVVNQPALDHPPYALPWWFPRDRTGLGLVQAPAARARSALAGLRDRLVHWRLLRLQNAARRAHGIPPLASFRVYLGFENPLLLNTGPGLDFPRPLCPNQHFVGPLTVPFDDADRTAVATSWDTAADLLRWLDVAEGPVVVVSFGTLVRPARAAVSAVAEATAAFDTLWVGGAGEGVGGGGGGASARHRVERFVPQQAVLAHPNTCALVSHCGLGSVSEAMAAGVPVVCVPFFADQLDICARLAAAGAGVCLPRADAVTAPALAGAIRAVVAANASFARAARRTGQRLLAYGGPRRAAALVEEALRLGYDHTVCPHAGEGTLLPAETLAAGVLVCAQLGAALAFVLARARCFCARRCTLCSSTREEVRRSSINFNHE